MIRRIWEWSPSAVLFRRVYGWMTLLAIVLWLVAILTGWINSVAFVSHISMFALVLGGASAWQSGRVEVKQDEAATDDAS